MALGQGFVIVNWVKKLPSNLVKTSSSEGVTSIKCDPTSIADTNIYSGCFAICSPSESSEL